MAHADGNQAIDRGRRRPAGAGVRRAGRPVAVAPADRRNPFYVTEILAASDDELPGTIRDAVLARAARLSEPALGALAAAAGLGRRVDTRLLTAVAAQPEAAILECVEQRVLVAAEDAWMFRHELARLAVDQTLPAGERVTLHRRALAQLEAAEPDNHRAVARTETTMTCSSGSNSTPSTTARSTPIAARHTVAARRSPDHRS